MTAKQPLPAVLAAFGAELTQLAAIANGLQGMAGALMTSRGRAPDEKMLAEAQRLDLLAQRLGALEAEIASLADEADAEWLVSTRRLGAIADSEGECEFF